MCSSTVVVVGADWRNGEAAVSSSAPAESWKESQAVSATVASIATSRNGDASVLSGAPAESSIANALSGDTVVVFGEGTSFGDGVTRIGSCAPAESDLEGDAVSAVIASEATRRNLDAGVFGDAPGVTDFANALTSLAVMVVRASGGDIVTSVGQRAPVGSGLEGDTSSAAIGVNTTARNSNASVLDGAPGESSGADALTSSAVVVRGERASFRKSVASVGYRTPAESDLESDASSAIVASETARRNANAS